MPLLLCHRVRADYLQCHLCICEGLSPAFSHHWLITPILQMEDIYLIDICNYNYIRLCTRNQVTMLITHHSQGAWPRLGALKVCSGWIWPPASALPAIESLSNWSNISICWSKSFSNGLAFMSYCASLDVTFYLLTGEKWFITLSWSHILMPYRIHALRKMFLFMARKDGQCGRKNYETEL